jgi:hypothetical protein
MISLRQIDAAERAMCSTHLWVSKAQVGGGEGLKLVVVEGRARFPARLRAPPAISHTRTRVLGGGGGRNRISAYVPIPCYLRVAAALAARKAYTSRQKYIGNTSVDL